MARLKAPPPPRKGALPKALADRDAWSGSIADMLAYNRAVHDWAERRGLVDDRRTLDYAKLRSMGIRLFSSRDRMRSTV